MKTPTAREKKKLVKSLAAYILKDGAKIGRQQEAYDRYMSMFLALEARYPQVNFRSEETTASLTRAATAEARKKLFRGPGATS